MIYTSYFAINAKNPKAISISLWVPKWFKGEQTLILAPKVEWFREWKTNPELDTNWYEEQYTTTVLDQLNVHEVAKMMQDRVMLCYEAADKFCHRHLAAAWLRKAGYEVEEMKFTKKIKPVPKPKKYKVHSEESITDDFHKLMDGFQGDVTDAKEFGLSNY